MEWGLEYPEKTTDMPQVTDKLLSRNIVSSTPLHGWYFSIYNASVDGT